MVFPASNSRWSFTALSGLRTHPYKETTLSRISLLCLGKESFTSISNSFLSIALNAMEKRLCLSFLTDSVFCDWKHLGRPNFTYVFPKQTASLYTQVILQLEEKHLYQKCLSARVVRLTLWAKGYSVPSFLQQVELHCVTCFRYLL